MQEPLRNRSLVLSRRVGESVIFHVAGIEMKITLGEVNRWGQVKLWFDVPLCVEIWREELLGDNRECP